MTGPLVLIEPYANRLGGHHQHTLVALAQARPGSLVIAPRGLARDAVAALSDAGARLVTASAERRAAVLLAAARLAAGLSAAGQRIFRSRRWPRRLRGLPHQITLIARCLTEASALRSARRLESGADAVVILTASEALHGAAALLGGQPHLRFVHEAVTTEDAVVRLLGRLAHQGEQQVIAVYPTQAVGDQFAATFPHLPAVVRAFAVDDGRRLTDAERDGGRTAFGTWWSRAIRSTKPYSRDGGPCPPSACTRCRVPSQRTCCAWSTSPPTQPWSPAGPQSVRNPGS
ncbi:hypothetical protein [Streptomyces sp. NPDC126514]|uniref:hypothetical protein n=1 Tax=Streptomyces sp. NPDC126514 TaxID=3155210 RepID=UPI00331ECBE9